MELYRKYRPKLFKHVVGQVEVVKSLTRFLKKGTLPHALLFAGPSGCGKTTLARILKEKLICSDMDFVELNAASSRGIATIRDIAVQSPLEPMSGACRIWLVDEAHRLTGEAQDAFLKLLEDTPAHVYLILATTRPDKLVKTIRTRMTQYNVRLLEPEEMSSLISRVCKKEGVELGEDVGDKLVEVAEGSPRQALVALNKITNLDKIEEQMALLERVGVEKKGIELAQALFRYKPSWKEVCGILRELEEDPESLRWMVLAYARKVLLGGGKSASRAFLIIDTFSTPFYDSLHAGLCAACYEVVVDDGR